MGYDISTASAYAVLFSVLGIFTLLAISGAGYITVLPSNVQSWLVAQNKENVTVAHAKEGSEELATTDFFL